MFDFAANDLPGNVVYSLYRGQYVCSILYAAQTYHRCISFEKRDRYTYMFKENIGISFTFVNGNSFHFLICPVLFPCRIAQQHHPPSSIFVKKMFD